jgi:DNA-binding NarL/FixJ family response regulator
MIRVIVADDHPVVRQGLRQIVEASEDIVVAGEATDGRDVLDVTVKHPADILLLDLSMPGLDGLDVLKQLRHDRVEIPVLVLTMHSEDEFALRAFKAGASGYLTKDSAPTELVAAIRRVVAGGRYVGPRLAEKLAGYLSREGERPLHERLSDREYQVLRMIAAGKTTREIAETLSLSIKTIGTYRARILEKMGMRTSAELIAYAVRQDLADSPNVGQSPTRRSSGD